MHSIAEDLARQPEPGFVPADRVQRLGTETVFAVSAEAAALASRGRTVYPFHLGDLNIPTADHIVEAMDRAIRDGRTTYCPNAGIAPLREALAADVSAARCVTYAADEVSVQPGGKPVIGKFLMAAMNAGDEVLYPNPGFPIYSSFVEFLGGVAVPYGYLDAGDRYAIDIDAIERRITPRTRILILNDLHNPTAGECTAEELERIAELALRHDLLVLSDEAYFDVRFEGASRSIVSLPGMQERTVILYTFSKKYAMTGWRLGAAIGPRPLVDIITQLNVNLESCPNHFAQYGALEALTGDQAGPREMMARLKGRRDAALRILNATPGVRCHTPESTFYLYPDVTDAVRLTGCAGHEDFRRLLLDATGVSFCTRLHFGKALPGENRYHLRLAYSGVSTAQIEEGLGAFKAFIETTEPAGS
ncbi:MAG: aminotransferase class I/II-fold pyridoxal phosphate-dependent enzyme [Actinobacteria bacterium]|nr:aminotransferase class I/II-fold pyridoxal phosphate-dependent enzyme [Actinomycetota bacterium]